MKNVSRILPMYTADTSGVCSALYEFGGMTVIHDASGCNSTYTTHDEPRWYDRRSMMFISALTEMDAIMGNDEKLVNDCVSAAHDLHPEFIALCGSPMPMMTGVDFAAIAAEIRGQTGIPTFGLNTNGTVSYISGAAQAFEALVREYAHPVPKREGTGVNILGMTPLDFPLGAERSVRRWLTENGMELVCNLGMGSVLDDVKQMTSARVNLVVSQTGAAAAEYLRKYLGMPYVFGVPIGRGFSAKLAEQLRAAAEPAVGGALADGLLSESDADTLVIGEAVYSASVCAALYEDMGIRAHLLCPLPCDDRFLAHTGGERIFAEEDIERYALEMHPRTVIADPLYRYIVPEGARHIGLPHLAFSGRSFQRSIPDLINTDIKEYFR